MESRIYLIRHGITEGNQKRWYYGASDIPLTHEGIELLKTSKEENEYPIDESFDYYTSGLKRTEETFNILFGDMEHQELKGFREMNFGEFECHSYDELKDNEAFKLWVGDKVGEIRPKGGESRKDFAKRVEEAVDELICRHNSKEEINSKEDRPTVSVVVCHGGVSAWAMKHLFPNIDHNWWEWIPDPGHGYAIEMRDGKPMDYKTI